MSKNVPFHISCKITHPKPQLKIGCNAKRFDYQSLHNQFTLSTIIK
nr:MAG TPA: hypothetical protein [Caudoviricetes sp.]DAT69575.1 MAG TPA: hypothetical protein [Caudoviricetes sp.]DAT69682.1 MAG TPA: hypothetical protein [Caudoviricetes sp.]